LIVSGALTPIIGNCGAASRSTSSIVMPASLRPMSLVSQNGLPACSVRQLKTFTL
jgi:hypothetical protein